MPACNLHHLLRNSQNSCGKFIPAGTGDRIYVFDLDDTPGLIDAEPSNDGFYSISDFDALAGKLYPIDIKTDSGQVTSEKAEDQPGRTLTGTAIIDHNIDKFLAIDAAMAFMNLGVLIPMDNRKCYVIMSPYKRVKYSSNYDSGTTYDSDHGFTITFTVSPVLYGCPMVNLTSSMLKDWSDESDHFSQYQGSSSSKKFVISKLEVATGATLNVTYNGTAITSGESYDKGKIVKVELTPSSGKKGSITINGIVVDQSDTAGDKVTWSTVLDRNMVVGAKFA